MKKVYQTIIDPDKGNCLQAALASLFDLPLAKVEHLPPDANQLLYIMEFYKKYGYKAGVFSHFDIKTVQEVCEYDGGVNGYFKATVKSRTLEDVWHAVIIDMTGTVVHDPNPNGKCLGLGPEHIESIMITKPWYVDKKGNFKTYG